MTDTWTEKDLFQKMLRIRAVEEAIAARYGGPGRPQEMRCPVHLSIGQEAIAAGVCAAMTKGDTAFGSHRCHAHYLAMGGDLKAMLAELYGKADGCAGGRGGSMHLMDKAAGYLLSIPIVGSSIPLAAGVALANKMDGNDRLCAAFFGDGAMEEGVWHETANFAALKGLPVLFVCENNFFSVYSHIGERQPDTDLSRFAVAHGVPVFQAPSEDVLAIYGEARKAVFHIRAGNGPAFILVDTYRHREHCGPNFDDDLGYRNEEERDAWFGKDPVSFAKARLIAEGALTEAELMELSAGFEAELEAAFSQAESASFPDPATVGDRVYA